MNKNRAVTYSLLAHIRQNSTLVKGPLDIFVPLLKRTLSKMNEDKIFSGKNINEIKTYTDKLYYLDFPFPVIRKILRQISEEVNTKEQRKLILNNDDSFQIIGYHFTEIEETINTHKNDVEQLEKMFKEFCDTNDDDVEVTSIFEFIDKNRQELSKYLANRDTSRTPDFTLEAQFVNFFKRIPELYEHIKGIYLGSIISTYIEFKTEPIDSDIELLFDTNFLVALLDLNTPESFHTAKTLMKVCENQGFKFTVLMDTINEMRGLLEAKALKFNESFLIKKIYAEDIYNACDRKGLNQADLERIADKLENLLNNEGINIVYHTEKYKNIAKYSSEYTTFQKYRNSKAAALHDATATHYVRQKRGKRISKFEKVNCWFVNNAISRDNNFYRKMENQNILPEQIKADDLLNVLWLSNPAVNQNMGFSDVADIGLSSLISVTLTENLPKSSLIRELDNNIHKYAQEEINDEDIIRLSTRIANKELKDLSNLNKLAELPSKEAFVKRLETEIEKQKRKEEERAKQFNNVLEEFQKHSKSLEKQKGEIEQKSKDFDKKINKISSDNFDKQSHIQKLENELEQKDQKRYKEKSDEFVKKQILRWRLKSIIPFIVSLIFLVCGVLYFLSLAEWNTARALTAFIAWKNNIIILLIIFTGGVFFSYSCKMMYDCFFNHTQIQNFKKGIDIPDKFE